MFDRINEGRWWDFGWQLVEGCTPVSEGCKHCWSLAKEHRLGISKEVHCMENRLERPLKRKKPTSYAIWNDLFHKDVPRNFIAKVLDIAYRAYINNGHIFLFLTKRPERMAQEFAIWSHLRGNDMMNLYGFWLGTSVENQKTADERIPILLQIPAAVRFVSLEPLLGSVDLKFGRKYYCPVCSDYRNDPYCAKDRVVLGYRTPIKWVIVGAETQSPAHRRVDYNKNAISIVKQCESAGVSVFVKSAVVNGRVTKKIEEFPPELRLRQKPERTE